MQFSYDEEVQEFIDKNGISNIDKFFKEKLEGWQDAEVNIGVTGDSGTGKSSFINAIREVDDDAEEAAKVGVKETTLFPTCYDHPSNPKIKLTDLPGVGTPRLSDLDSYCRETNLDDYDTFLIFSSTRFTKKDWELAEIILSLKKKFFFVRNKIDENVRAEQRKKSTFNETAVLEEIRNDCVHNLSHLLKNMEDVFLISNHYPLKWDFDRLTCAILDVLPMRQKEALCLSLKAMSKHFLKKKIELLCARIPLVAGLSAVSAAIPIPGLSIAVDIGLITKELKLYRSQLGIPSEGCKKFLMLKPATQALISQIFQTIASAASLFSKYYVAETALEEVARLLVPILGSVIAGGMSFTTTYCVLKQQLDEISEVAFKVLEETTRLSSEDHHD
ncbi:Interferon-inducible GTPase 5 [Exaiptasia diaphana]|nr:Interferon-inducible GTPase 5 [Exaiptasia diaphana]